MAFAISRSYKKWIRCTTWVNKNIITWINICIAYSNLKLWARLVSRKRYNFIGIWRTCSNWPKVWQNVFSPGQSCIPPGGGCPFITQQRLHLAPSQAYQMKGVYHRSTGKILDSHRLKYMRSYSRFSDFFTVFPPVWGAPSITTQWLCLALSQWHRWKGALYRILGKLLATCRS